LIALAEKAWHRPAWEPDYNSAGAIYSSDTNFLTEENISKRELDWQIFANALAQKELPKLDMAGWSYRIPTLGARYKDGKLSINSIFPGMTMQYQVDEGSWVTYPNGMNSITVETSGTIKVRAKSADGLRTGRSLLVNTIK